MRRCPEGIAIFMHSLITAIETRFLAIDNFSRDLLSKLQPDELYLRPRDLPNSMAMFSCGEYILRSAAMVEKCFGGITTRLWDDPFEWTLPEKLIDAESIAAYLDEAETVRRNGFSLFATDADLLKEIPAPDELTPIVDILLDTLTRASHFQGRAFAIFQVISDKKLPRF